MLLIEFLQSPVSSVAMKAVEVCESIMQSGFSGLCEENKEKMKFQLEFVTKLEIDKMIANVSYYYENLFPFTNFTFSKPKYVIVSLLI
jgi:hypothetical protein